MNAITAALTAFDTVIFATAIGLIGLTVFG
jgi:hypothetical protein